MRGVLTGRGGVIWWRYHRAARVDDYTITRHTSGYYLRATLVDADATRLQQDPLVFVMPLTYQGNTVTWRWPVLTPIVTEGVLAARLGPVEVSDGALSGSGTATRPTPVVGR